MVECSTDAEETILLSDVDLIDKADQLLLEIRSHAAARLLEKVRDGSLLLDRHHSCLATVREMEEMMRDLVSPAPTTDGWKKQVEGHNKRYDSRIYYKVDENYCLIGRLEAVIPSSLLAPLLAVWNESDLFATWLPSWNHPRLGVQKSQKLKDLGRGSQIVYTLVSMPFPFANRDVVIKAVTSDAIDEKKAILILAKSPSGSVTSDGFTVPEPDRSVVRMHFEGAIVIRSCPPNHPLLAHSKVKFPQEEKRILVTQKILADARVSLVPQWLINFVTKNVLSTILAQLLRVAEQVRDGKRPQHLEAMQNHAELYQWIARRSQVMIDRSAE